MRGGVLLKSGDVVSVDDAGDVLTMGRKENGGKGGKKAYIYSSTCDLIHIPRFVG